ncbi:MAG TPA: sigma 54-interacting transcriptional regulator [Thermoanaerobaculia bacterium]|jgi:two-component system nitrogen regulation response regulator GlnG|nr:sigma 54-interacting transcriptional regulator [Thermoanaerobaculia bacterium]
MAKKTADHRTTRAAGPPGTAESLRLRVPGLVVLSHPDPRRVGDEAALIKLGSGQTVGLSRREPDFAPPGPEASFRPLDDTFLSRSPLRLSPGPEPGSIVLDRSGSPTHVTAGGEDVATSRTFTAAEIERGVVLVLGRRIALLLHPVDPVPVSVPGFGLVGESATTLRLRQEIRSAAGLDVPVLLRGETGTGKELVARALHDAGKRCEGPYVAVNMAALAPSLAAAELFGAERGAYTGADRKKTGFFQSAQGGTLFLDEVGDMPPEVQTLLLRVLENREIQPVGSVETIPIDVRIVAATDAALEAAIAEGRFRAPLLHRLAGFEIRLPALRERRDDVARLFLHFLRDESQAVDETRVDLESADRPWPPAELVARLVEHDWPGNIRQLRNVTRRLLIARRDGLGEKELGRLVDQLLAEPAILVPQPVAEAPPAPASQKPPAGIFVRRFRRSSEVSDEELLAALEHHRWQLQPAAEALRVSRPTLYRLIESCPQIRKAAELERAEIASALADCGGDPAAAAARLRVSPQGLKRRMTLLGLR